MPDLASAEGTEAKASTHVPAQYDSLLSGTVIHMQLNSRQVDECAAAADLVEAA